MWKISNNIASVTDGSSSPTYNEALAGAEDDDLAAAAGCSVAAAAAGAASLVVCCSVEAAGVAAAGVGEGAAADIVRVVGKFFLVF